MFANPSLFKPNQRVPFSEQSFKIGPGLTRDCIVLTKFRPTEAWTKFTWKVAINQPSQYSMTPHIPDSMMPQQAIVGPSVAIPGVALPPPTPIIVEDEPMIEDDVLACPVCTFHNFPGCTMCEVCGSALAK